MADNTLNDELEQLRADFDKIQEDIEDLGERVGDHPLSSLGIAFGAGFIIAKLFELVSRR